MSGVFRRMVHTPGKSDEGTRLTFGPFCGWNWPKSTGSRPPSQLMWRAAAVAAAAVAAAAAPAASVAAAAAAAAAVVASSLRLGAPCNWGLPRCICCNAYCYHIYGFYRTAPPPSLAATGGVGGVRAYMLGPCSRQLPPPPGLPDIQFNNIRAK